MKKIVLGLAIGLLVVNVGFAGIEWKSKTVTQGEAKEANNAVVMQLYAQGGNVRQDFISVERQEDMRRPGGYWLYKADGNRLYSVDPSQKTYSEIPLDFIFRMGGLFGQIVKIKITDPLVKFEKLGTETIMGYSCQHSRLVIDYDMEVKIAFIKNRSHEHIDKETWTASQIKGFLDIGEGFRYRDYKTGNQDLDQLIEVQLKAEQGLGFPLKTVSVTTSTDKKGNVKEKSRMTQEVLSLAVKNISAALFEIPVGYQEKEFLVQE